MSSYQMDLIGTDGKSTSETHEIVKAEDHGIYIRDNGTDTWIPWSQIHVVSITELDPPVVIQPKSTKPKPIVSNRPSF